MCDVLGAFKVTHLRINEQTISPFSLLRSAPLPEDDLFKEKDGEEEAQEEGADVEEEEEEEEEDEEKEGDKVTGEDQSVKSLAVKEEYDKVNRCLARYSPRHNHQPTHQQGTK